MAAISAAGLGSGIDINSLVQQLVSSEGQPQFNAINNQISAAQTRLSALGSLNSALSSFQTAVQRLKNASAFQPNTATSSDETIARVTAGAGSVSGSHTLEVQALAKAQNSISTAEFADFTDVVGTGTLTFTKGSGSSFSVTIDSTNNTLDTVRDAINNATDNNGLVASIISVDSTTTPGTTIKKLVLTAKEAGTANAFTVTGTDGDGNGTDNAGLSRLFSTNLNNQTTASNAVIKIDGQTATRSTNSINDVLPGITFDLQSAEIGKEININVNVDTKSVTTTLNGFITAYNNLRNTTNSLGRFAAAGSNSNGPLLGDSTLRLITGQLRQDTSGTVSSAPENFNTLASVGINIDRSGVISLDSTQLQTALNNNPNALSNVFASTDGVATRLDARLTEYLQSGGSLDSQQKTLNTRITRLNDQTAAVQRRLDSLQASLTRQFTALDVAVAQFNTTGSFLTQQFG